MWSQKTVWMCKYDVNNPAIDSQYLCGEIHSIKNNLPMIPFDSVKLSSELQVKWLCYALHPPNILLACVSFLSARGSSQQNVADWGSVGVFVVGVPWLDWWYWSNYSNKQDLLFCDGLEDETNLSSSIHPNELLACGQWCWASRLMFSGSRTGN